MACHTSKCCIDFLGEIIGTDCDMDMSIHRTKCAALIKNVFAPCMFNNLLKDIGESRYSLIIDESTDISSVKQLCAVIRYFSTSLKKIVSTYLGLIDLQAENAVAIASTLTTFLESVGIDFMRCVGLGTDGCSVMVGNNNSVYTHLRGKN